LPVEFDIIYSLHSEQSGGSSNLYCFQKVGGGTVRGGEGRGANGVRAWRGACKIVLQINHRSFCMSWLSTRYVTTHRICVKMGGCDKDGWQHLFQLHVFTAI